LTHGITARVAPVAQWPSPPKTLAEMEKEYIKFVLQENKGNRSAAAKTLGIDRKTLWAKIKKYRIELESS